MDSEFFITNDFGSSAFYWEQNNPGMIRWKNAVAYNYLSYCGMDPTQKKPAEYIKESESVRFVRPLLTDPWNRGALDRVTDALIVEKFFEYGLNSGLINIECPESPSELKLCSKLYGNWVYAIYECPSAPLEDSSKKRKRCVRFYDEYILGRMNAHYLWGAAKPENYKFVDEEHYHGAFTRLNTNGMFFGSNLSLKEYYDYKRLNLSVHDLIYLFFFMLSHVDEQDSNLLDERGNKTEAWYLVKDKEDYNLIGFGWLPCLYAKPTNEWNEADRFVDFAYREKWHGTIDNHRRASLGG